MTGAGTVYWMTGMSGSGKTTLARLFVARLRAAGRAVVLFDGDELRGVFQGDGHAEADRRRVAMRNARLCKLVADQGMDVVCATISLFHECHRWNRAHLSKYVEIHVRASLEVLRVRDSKALYALAERGEVTDVVGLHIRAEEPENPDVTLDNDGHVPPETVVEHLWKELGL